MSSSVRVTLLLYYSQFLFIWPAFMSYVTLRRKMIFGDRFPFCNSLSRYFGIY